MEVEKVPINQNGIIGSIFKVSGAKKCAGLIIISGSEGGIPDYIAQRFVAPDRVIFALAYFGVPGLQKFLEEIPLEYFLKAIDFFGTLPEVDPDKIGLIGNSRGAELVLLLAATANLNGPSTNDEYNAPNMISAPNPNSNSAKIMRKVKGICALVPSCYVNGGFPHPNKPAWTFKSRPVAPFLKGLTSDDSNLTERQDLETACKQNIIPYHQGSDTDPYNVADLFEARERAAKNLIDIEIPIEKISIPVLALGSQGDQIWPSESYLERLRQRMDDSHGSLLQTLFFERAGHGIAFPYFREFDKPIFHPVGEFWCTAGGVSHSNETASEATKNRIVEFFQTVFNTR